MFVYCVIHYILFPSCPTDAAFLNVFQESGVSGLGVFAKKPLLLADAVSMLVMGSFEVATPEKAMENMLEGGIPRYAVLEHSFRIVGFAGPDGGRGGVCFIVFQARS